MSDYYFLNEEKIAIPCDMETWSNMHRDQRRVAEDTVNGFWVSTVFLGLNHAFSDGPPMIFETYVFTCDEAGKVTDWSEIWGRRTSTYEMALENHRDAKTRAEKGDWGDS